MTTPPMPAMRRWSPIRRRSCGMPASLASDTRKGRRNMKMADSTHTPSEDPLAAFEPASPSQHVPLRPTFLRSFVYAGRGLCHTLRTQRNMRVHVGLACAAIALAMMLGLSPVEFAMIFVAITSVLLAEMFNTIAEACVALAPREYHPLARTAKDVAAGAVLLSAILAVVIALFVYLPHLWPLILHLLGR